MRISRTGAFVGGIACAVVIGSGTAVATNGASLLIGKGNTGSATTGLSNSTGTPLSLAAKKGTPPLKVNNTVKVKNLDSDLLDGKDSGAFLAKTGKAADAAKLNGKPASTYLPTVYAAQTFYDSPTTKVSTHDVFDTITVPAGTYLVELAADLANVDATNGEFGCHVAAHDAGGTLEGEYGNVSLNPGPSTFGTTSVNQMMTLTTAGTINAYCYVNAGDAGQDAFVYNSTLTATVIGHYVGAVHGLSTPKHAKGTQPKAARR